MAYLCGLFYGSKHISKQAWQNSSYFVTTYITQCTHNMAAANIDST